MLDLVIIGGSAAGISSAIYASRRNLNFKMVTNDLGGEVALSGEVGNWPGIINIQGHELAKKFADHIKHYQVDIDEGYRVEKITKKDNYWLVKAKNFNGKEEIYETKTVIIATGIHPRELNLPGEKEFRGKGITYCTVCDGPLFKGKVTTTIGAGNSALESALMMSGIAQKIYLITKYDNIKENNGGFPNGENILIDKVKDINNIEIIYNALTTKIVGENMVNGLEYKDTKTGEDKNLEIQGAMIHIGQIPNSDFVDCVDKDKMKQIIVDKKCRTSCEGIFAAGDVTDIPYKQIGIATGQGIIAGLAAIEYINKWE